MYSAFGVDHGDYEVSKAGFGQLRRAGQAVSGMGTALGAATHKLGGAMQARGAKNFANVARQTRGMPTAQRAMAMKGAKVGAGAWTKPGGALKSLGAGMMKRPGLTGGAALGGVAAAPAAVGGTMGVRSGMKQRQTY